MNHPFHNGNKRTALASLIIFFDHNERRLTSSDDELFDFVKAIADKVAPYDGTADEVVGAITNWLRDRVSVGREQASEMGIDDFLENCRRAGAVTRSTSDRRSWLVISANGKRSIRLSKKTPKLSGQVVKRYLTVLEMSEARTGRHFDEFQDGISPDQQVMLKYRNVFRRLAYA